MPEYRRFIAYFYEYIDGRKQKNAGFAKVELRNGMWRILFRLTTGVLPQPPVQVYGFVREQGYLLGFPMGTMPDGCEIAEEWAYRADSPIGLDRYRMEELSGIWIQSGEERRFITVWDDDPIDPAKFVLELPQGEMERQQSETDSLRGAANAEQSKADGLWQASDAKQSEADGAQWVINVERDKVNEAYRGVNVEQDKVNEAYRGANAEQGKANEVQRGTNTEQKAMELHRGEKTLVAAEEMHKVKKSDVREFSAEKAYLTEIAQEIEENALPSERVQEIKEAEGQNFTKVSQREKEVKLTSQEKCQQGTMARKDPRAGNPCQPCPPLTLAEEFLQKRQRFTPFQDQEIQDCVQLMPCDVIRMQQENWPVGRSSFLQHGFYQYHHLLFGRRKDGRYVLGVPGIRSRQEQYMAGMLGYDQFKMARICDCGRMFGYWYRVLPAELSSSYMLRNTAKRPQEGC